MTTEFDDEAGVLRLSHRALSVLALLAVAPTDPSLTDHATAPPLAELRAAGILGARGIDPAVRPLAEVMGAPVARLQLVLEEGGRVHRGIGWARPHLLVLALRAPVDDEAYDLMAEAPSEAPGLLGELVGLGPAPPASGDAVRTDADGLADLLVGASRSRWRLVVGPGDVGADDVGPARVLEVVDAGEAGLFELHPVGEVGSGAVELRPTDPMAVRSRIAGLLAHALLQGQGAPPG